MMPYSIPTIIDADEVGIGLGQTINTDQSNSLVTLVFTSIIQSSPTVVTCLGKFVTLWAVTGFYNGTEFAAMVQTMIQRGEVAAGVPAGTFTAEFDTVNRCIVLKNTSDWDDTLGATNWSLEFTSAPPVGSTTATINKPNFLWSMGLRGLYAQYPPILNAVLSGANTGYLWSPVLMPIGYPNVAPLPVFPPAYVPNTIVCSPYTGLYTQYIDICSPTLCQAQYVRDGNTNQSIIRRDLIARVYIASEISTPTTDPVGTRPFTIHRQFKNAKVMKWTAERSIDAIELILFDQFGNQLPIIPPMLSAAVDPDFQDRDTILQGQPADFAITFLVDEHDETMEHNYGYTA